MMWDRGVRTILYIGGLRYIVFSKRSTRLTSPTQHFRPAMSELHSATKYYRHGRFALTGGTLADAITAYKTYGDPKNPCIVFPTCYGGKLDSKLLNSVDRILY